MSDHPVQQPESTSTEPTPAAGAPKTGGGAVKDVLMPVAEAAIGGVVSAAVRGVAQKATQKP